MMHILVALWTGETWAGIASDIISGSSDTIMVRNYLQHGNNHDLCEENNNNYMQFYKISENK